MSEEMPYIPYGGEGEWKKRFEMTIPILLLILVLVIVAWKMEWLAGVPFFGCLLGGGTTNIAIIGNDQNIVKTIDTVIKKDLPVNYMVFNKADLDRVAYQTGGSEFEKYDMIILTEGQDGDTIALEQKTLEQLADFVNSGKPAIVIGLAGNKVESSNNQGSGWSVLGFVPATCQSINCEVSAATFDRINMYPMDINNPILKEFPGSLNFSSGQITYTIVNAAEGATPILSMAISTGVEVPAYSGYAMIERSGSLGSSKVMYFAFQPSLYPPLLYNTIKNLKSCS
jgi:hypothetical protein